jgi:site-specific DNA-cytosine methylase
MVTLGVSSGNGVMLHPFKDWVIGNIECRSDYTHRGNPLQFHLNFPDVPFYKTLPSISGMFVLPEIIIGHPKCGNSSILSLSRRKSFKSHKSEPSLDLFFESIHLYKPKLFLLENLPKLLETYSEADFRIMFPNFSFVFWQGSLSELGNSQENRIRLLIVGINRKKFNKQEVLRLRKIFKTKFKVTEPKNTKELLKNLPDNGNFRPDLDTRLAFYGGRQETYRSIQDLWQSQGPDAKRFKTPDEKFSTAPGVYKDLDSSKPATIRKSNRCFNPDGLTYTPRERARIQGIPDSFKIMETDRGTTDFNKGCVTTGSTPPYEVGLWFKQCLIKAQLITSN